MTQSLMGRYQEYSRRKMIPFKLSVEHGKKCFDGVSLTSHATSFIPQLTKPFSIPTDWTATPARTLRTADPTWKSWT